MQDRDGAGTLDRRVLKLNPGFDPGSMRPSSVEFFLLSRIDGFTPWCVLREMGGMTAEESDLCLEGWLAAGHVQISHVDGTASEGKCPSAAEKPLAIDTGLDLDVSIQKRVIEMRLLLHESDQSLLGVTPDMDEKSIKRAYFKLSREFHPDRFFRRELGPYRSEVEKLFKGIQRAYVNLSQSPSKSPMSGQKAGRNGRPGPDHQDDQVSVRRRAVPDHVDNEHYQKARELMKAAAESMSEARFEEAHQCLRIAEKFCPEFPSLDQAMADVLARLREESAQEEEQLDAGSPIPASSGRYREQRRSGLFCRGET